MGHRCGLLELACLVLLGCAFVRGQGETHLPEDEDVEMDGEEEEDSPGAVTNAKGKLSCPEKCSCTAEGSVDCNGVSLSEFPEELSEHTRQLSLQVCVCVCSESTARVFSV